MAYNPPGFGCGAEIISAPGPEGLQIECQPLQGKKPCLSLRNAPLRRVSRANAAAPVKLAMLRKDDLNIDRAFDPILD